MKLSLLALILSFTALGQPVGVGLKIGVPLTDAFNIASGNAAYTQDTHRYTLGPYVELHLPFRFGVEVDALYRSFQYQSIASVSGAIVTGDTSSGAWEFPVLAKYRFGLPLVKPFVDAGPTFSHLSGLKELLEGRLGSGSTNIPAELNHSSNFGVTFGAGLEIHAALIRLSPEVRYTRWSVAGFSAGGFASNQNQAVFLVGIGF